MSGPGRSDRALVLVSAAVFAVGAAAHGFPPTLPLMRALTPWVLLAFGVLSLRAAVADQGGGLLSWGAAAALATFLLEALGVATGLVFGSYSYGTALGFAVLGVPPLIGFNWTLVVLGLSRGALLLRPGIAPAIGAALVGAAAVCFDWILEPLAIRLGYWTWTDGAIPLQNYAAWFAIAALCSYPLFRFRKRPARLFPTAYVGIQAVFFVLVRAALAFV